MVPSVHCLFWGPSTATRTGSSSSSSSRVSPGGGARPPTAPSSLFSSSFCARRFKIDWYRHGIRQGGRWGRGVLTRARCGSGVLHGGAGTQVWVGGPLQRCWGPVWVEGPTSPALGLGEAQYPQNQGDVGPRRAVGHYPNDEGCCLSPQQPLRAWRPGRARRVAGRCPCNDGDDDGWRPQQLLHWPLSPPTSPPIFVPTPSVVGAWPQWPRLDG